MVMFAICSKGPVINYGEGNTQREGWTGHVFIPTKNKAKNNWGGGGGGGGHTEGGGGTVLR